MTSSWRERIFGLDTSDSTLSYFRTEDAYNEHVHKGAATQAGVIALNTAIMYVADYMDYPFCIELATRDAKAVTTRHYFLFASTAADMRSWMEAIVAAGATAAGPIAPMRVVPEGKKGPAAALLGIDSAASSASVANYNSLEDAAALAPLEFPVRLAKYGFLQKRGRINPRYQTRFCRVEMSASNQPALVYYSSVETTPRNGEIPLTGIVVENGEETSVGFVARSVTQFTDGHPQLSRSRPSYRRLSECDGIAFPRN